MVRATIHTFRKLQGRSGEGHRRWPEASQSGGHVRPVLFVTSRQDRALRCVDVRVDDNGAGARCEGRCGCYSRQKIQTHYGRVGEVFAIQGST